MPARSSCRNSRNGRSHTCSRRPIVRRADSGIDTAQPATDAKRRKALRATAAWGSFANKADATGLGNNVSVAAAETLLNRTESCMQTFDIYFLGQVLPDADPASVKRNVAALFKMPEASADRLFTGKALRVKQAIDAEAAGRYRAAFRDAGALIQIVPAGSPPPADAAAGLPATPDATSSPPPAPETSGMGLAAPGAIIDETPAPPPAEIDTSGLSALPPNSGSLEDCRIDKEPYPIPDISHLKIVDS